MTKANIIKAIGTACSFVLTGGALFVHEPYRDLLLAVAACALSALHIQRPGDVKAAS